MMIPTTSDRLSFLLHFTSHHTIYADIRQTPHY
jgi:hypothetical protein